MLHFIVLYDKEKTALTFLFGKEELFGNFCANITLEQRLKNS